MPTKSDLPRNLVSWQAEPGRALLLIHDMQRYFVDFFPPDQAPIKDLIDNVRRLRAVADEFGIPVAYTAQPGAMTRVQRGLLHDFWGPGMGRDPGHRAIIAELTPGESDTVLTKWRYSAFQRTGLKQLMDRYRRDQLIICGIYAHIGCLMTANDAFSMDIQPFMVADALADFSPGEHQMALDYAARRCAATVSTSQVIDDLLSGTMLESA
jgi:bifunctional isochorismate lyase/aryl carrier protein